MAEEITSLQTLLARLKDRAEKLRAVDPTLSRDVELLGGALDQLRSGQRVLASAILAIDMLASSRTGALVTEATRKILEQMIVDPPREQPIGQNTDRRHRN